MTPTEQDKELETQIQKVIASCLRFYGDIQRDSQTCTSELMQLITADRKRVALEARIDELTRVLQRPYISQHVYGQDRIAELKAHQEEV